MQKPYREFQFAGVLLVIVLLVQGLFALLFVMQIGTKPIGLGTFLGTSGVSAIITMSFYGMRTRIDSSQIVVSFGVGLIRKTVGLNRIESLEVVSNPWYYGWGIRLIPNGILYNISGADAIEIKLKDTNRIVRIGTRDPKLLIAEIQSRIK